MTQPHGGHFSLSSLKYPKISCEPMEKNNITQTLKLGKNIKVCVGGYGKNIDLM